MSACQGSLTFSSSPSDASLGVTRSYSGNVWEEFLSIPPSQVPPPPPLLLHPVPNKQHLIYRVVLLPSPPLDWNMFTMLHVPAKLLHWIPLMLCFVLFLFFCHTHSKASSFLYPPAVAGANELHKPPAVRLGGLLVYIIPLQKEACFTETNSSCI